MYSTVTQIALGDAVYICCESGQSGAHLTSDGYGDSQLKVAAVDAETIPTNFHQRIFVLEKVSTWASVPTSVGAAGGNKETAEAVMFGSLVQLRHRASNRTVAVHRHREGKSRATYHVLLKPSETQDSTTVFRVMPRYKIRQEGEKIGQGDHLVFLNEQYKVYLSSPPGSLTVTASSTPTEFSIQGFEPKQVDPTLVRAGQGILLFHKEQESFLTGTSDGPSSVVFNHPRITDSTYSIAKLNYSSNSLWLVECANPAEGGAVRPAPDTFRLRHLATGGYLTVTASEKATKVWLNKDPLPVQPQATDTALWNFVACDTREKTISSSSTFFRMYNPATGTWLHAAPKGDDEEVTPMRTLTLPQRPASDDGNNFSLTIGTLSVNSLTTVASGVSLEISAFASTLVNPAHYLSHWDFSVAVDEKENVKATKEDASCAVRPKPAYVDVFCATTVAPASVKDLLMVLGHATSVRNLATKVSILNADQFTAFLTGDPDHLMDLARGALSALLRFCTHSEVENELKRLGLPIQKNQRMLMEQGVHLVVLDFLFSVFSPDRQRKAVTKSAAAMKTKIENLGNSSSLLSVLLRANPEDSEAFINVVTLSFRFLTLFCRNYDLGCAALLPYLDSLCRFLEFFSVVAELLVEMAALTTLPTENVVKLAKTALANIKKHPEPLFKLLSALTQLRGNPDLMNQNIVFESVLEDGQSFPHIYEGEVGASLAVKTPYTKGTYMLVTAVLASKDELSSAFFAGSWSLLAACNYGVPYRNQSWLRPEQIVAILRLEQLQANVFCSACKLATSFISGQVTESKNSSVWSYNEPIEKPTREVSLSIAAAAVTEKMKEILLSRLTRMTSSYDQFRRFIVEVREILIFWNSIALGRLYSGKDRTALLNATHTLLMSFPEYALGSPMLRWTEENVLVMECLNHVTNLLHTFLDHAAEKNAMKIRSTFKQEPTVDPKEFGEKASKLCVDEELFRSSWVLKFVDLARFEHKRLANNVLRCSFRILTPLSSALPHLTQALVFQKECLSTLPLIREGVDALHHVFGGGSRTRLKARGAHGGSGGSVSSTAPSGGGLGSPGTTNTAVIRSLVADLRGNVEGCMIRGAMRDAQWTLFQCNAHEILFDILSTLNSHSPDDLTLGQDALFVLNCYVQGCDSIRDTCLKYINVLLQLVSFPRLFTSKDCIQVINSLFQTPRDLGLDFSHLVSEYLPAQSVDVSEAGLECLASLVKNTTGETQSSILVSLSSALTPYEHKFPVGFGEDIQVGFLELLAECYTIRPSTDFGAQVVQLEALLQFIATTADEDRFLRAVRAACVLFLEAEGSPLAQHHPEIPSQVLVRVIDRLNLSIVGRDLSTSPPEPFRFLTGLLNYTLGQRSAIMEPVFEVAKRVVDRLAISRYDDKARETAKWCLSMLEAAEVFLAPAIIPHLVSQRSALAGTLKYHSEKAPQSPTAEPSDEEAALEKERAIVEAWLEIRNHLKREWELPNEDLLEPLTQAINNQAAPDSKTASALGAESATAGGGPPSTNNLASSGSGLLPFGSLSGAANLMLAQESILITFIYHLRETTLEDWVTCCLLTTLSTLLNTAMNDSDSTLIAIQNRMNALNATPLISTLLERSTYQVVQNAVQFGIALLHGGNKKCQDALLHYFNTHDEKFFYTIRKYLKLAQEDIIAKRASGTREDLLGENETGMLALVEPLCRLLQLLAEGHHFEFQNYLRHQHDNFNSYNMCYLVMEMMHTVIKRFDPSCVDIADQCLNTLTEFCQGPCPENQAAIVGCNVVTEVNHILTMMYSEEFDAEETMGLKSAGITTLLSLLEGSQDPTIPNLILTTINTQALEELLQTVWEEKSDETFLDLGFNIFILANVLITEGDKTLSQKITRILKHSPGYDFFNSMVCSIEIWRDDDPNSRRLETVYFRKPDICKLREETRESVLNTVNRSSLIAKHSDFFTVADDLIFEMEYQALIEEFANSLPPWQNPLGIAKCRPRNFENLLLGLGIFSNFLLINGYQTREGASSYTAAFMFFLMGLTELAASLYLIVVRFVLRLPLLNHRGCTEKNIEDKFLTLSTVPEMIGAVVSAPAVWAVATESYTLFFSACAVISFMATFSNPFYSCFLLLTVMYKAPLLSNIVKAITTNGRQLLLTAFLGAIMVYFFSVIGYLYFHEHFSKDGQTESNCDSLVECFFFSFGKGVRGGGGIGEEMTLNEWSNPSFFLRETYDTLFFVTVAVIVMNIIFALIVDTFAELRDARNKIEEDMETLCFICGIDAATFEREGERFKDHTHGPHNMWRYLYFMHHLRRKERSEFTGQETYVYEKMRRKDLTFFPVNRSRSLEKADTGAAGSGETTESQAASQGPSLAQIKQALEEVIVAHAQELGQARNKQAEAANPPSTGAAASLWGKAKVGVKGALTLGRPSSSGGPGSPTSRGGEEEISEEDLSIAPTLRGISEVRAQLARAAKMLEETNGFDN